MYHYVAGVPGNEPRGAIIFVHGAGGNHRHWDYQLPYLGQVWLTIAVDLPGHGLSEGRAAQSIEDYANFIYDFAEHVVGTRFILAGHSMGGAIAMNFALRFPQQLAGLILVGTGARLRVAPEMLEHFGAGKHFLPLNDLAYGPDTPAELITLAREEMLQTNPEVYHHDFIACNGFDVMSQVKDINVPTLVLGASEDRLTPVKYSRYLANQINNAQLEIIAGAGHMMMYEKPAAFNRYLQQFTTTAIY
ncbi:MAG: alpha/beta hydrolase [Desulfotomaculum sp. BICA1-6]|nr:MAG: alpha/beta hydrolase [Peptococcaceae bacterium BRH_c8a]KJS76681.1 MAG: alpha/beta hydrolase [Desulfotomaculum sp. BICA1-6]